MNSWRPIDSAHASSSAFATSATPMITVIFGRRRDSQERGQIQRRHDQDQPAGHRIRERIDRPRLRQLRRLQQHDLLVHVGDGDVLHDRESARDQALLDLVDDLGQVEDDLVALERNRAGLLLPLQQANQGLLGPGVDPDPNVGEGIRCHERANLTVDQPVDRARQWPDQLLQAGTVGDDPGEDLVQDRLDVDLLLDGVGDRRRDGVLHLGRIHQGTHRVEIPLGVIQRALAPVRDQRRRREQHGQHDTDDHPDERPVLRRSRGRRLRWSGWILRRTFPASSAQQAGLTPCRPAVSQAVGPGTAVSRSSFSSRAHLRSGLVHRAPDPARPPAEPPRSSPSVAALRRSLGRDFGQPRVSGDHPQGMKCPLQPSRQAAQADTPSHPLINHDRACPRSDCRSTHPHGADQARWTPAAAGSNSHETVAAGRRPLPTRQVIPSRQADPRPFEPVVMQHGLTTHEGVRSRQRRSP